MNFNVMYMRCIILYFASNGIKCKCRFFCLCLRGAKFEEFKRCIEENQTVNSKHVKAFNLSPCLFALSFFSKLLLLRKILWKNIAILEVYEYETRIVFLLILPGTVLPGTV